MKFEESTVLELGARGKHAGAPFSLVGRTVVRSKSGGLWNEWTVKFDDGRIAFLAEARGMFTLLFERPFAPSRDSLVVGEPLDTGFLVAERGQAQRIANWGDPLPAPKSYTYADLSSRSGETATIDWGEDEPHVFVGKRVELAQMGLRPRAERPRFIPVKSTPAPKGFEPCLAVGDEGTLGGVKWRVLGLVQRSIRIEGTRYTWEEYLLHDPAAGFRWLVVSDGHWNFVEIVELGRVTVIDDDTISFEGEKYRFYSGGKARVEWATGEMPWDVVIGDETEVADYVKVPCVISGEFADDEITWSRGTYTPPETVAKSFGKRVLPKPEGRAPNQPKRR